MCKNQCETIHSNPLFTKSENRSSVKFSNPSRYDIAEYAVDGCCITEGERCDYMINVEATQTSILVELKGCDVKKAISQLNSTSLSLAACIKRNKIWIVSSTRCPLTSTEIQSEKLKALRKGYTLIIKNSPVSYTI